MRSKKIARMVLSAVMCLVIPSFTAACGETDAVSTVKILAPAREVCSYVSAAETYLKANDPNVADYLDSNLLNADKPVTVQWECDGKDVVGYRVEYATQPGYSDAIAVETEENVFQTDLYNLYKGTEYYVRVTAERENGSKAVAESTFTTSSLGPRVMKAEGLYNARDLGGYAADNGKTTLQGMIYRGGALTPSRDYQTVFVTDAGKQCMAETMKIKLEMDLRSQGENLNVPEGDSVIPGARMEYFHVDGYMSAFSDDFKDSYRKVFSALAVPENYPVYMHCTGGADRTGTVAFLLNALLGVSEKDLIHDYEFTSFSFYGERNTKTGYYADYYIPFREKLETFSGETLSEKTENYLLWIGVTEQEIASIKTIMFGA